MNGSDREGTIPTIVFPLSENTLPLPVQEPPVGATTSPSDLHTASIVDVDESTG